MLHVLNFLKASFGNKFICKLHLSRILLLFSRNSYNYWLTRSATGGMCHLTNLTKKEHWPSMEAHIAQFLQREWLISYTRPIDSIHTIPKKRDLLHCSDIRLIANLSLDWLLPIDFSDYERLFFCFYTYSISCYMIVSNSFLANLKLFLNSLNQISSISNLPYFTKLVNRNFKYFPYSRISKLKYSDTIFHFKPDFLFYCAKIISFCWLSSTNFF